MTGQMSMFDNNGDRDKKKVMQIIDSIEINKDVPGVQLGDLIPNNALLELNKHYELSAINVSRILGNIRESTQTATPIARDELGKQLGMTKAMAKGTISMMRELGLIDSKTHILPLGDLILDYVPYFDDAGILWLLHFILASNARLVLWSNLFDMHLPENEYLSVQDISQRFQVLEGRWSSYSIRKKIPQELNAIFKTYTNEFFTQLGIIENYDGEYQIGWNTGVIPKWVWLSALLIFRDRYYPGASSLEIRLIAQSHYSPGRIFRVNESNVRKALDELHNADLLTVETRSGLDQVRFKREITWLSAITEYLQGA